MESPIRQCSGLQISQEQTNIKLTFLILICGILKKASDDVHILRNIIPILDTGVTGVRNTALTLFTFLQYYSWFQINIFNTNDHQIK